MRAANAALIAFLATRRNCIAADLFLVTLQNGTVYAWTSYDQALLVPPYTYSPLGANGTRGPLIDRNKWGIKNTIEVPEMQVTIMSDGYDMPDGSNLKLAVHNGLFDYATFTLSRIIMPTPGDTSLGAVPLFTGNVAGVDIDALSITITVKGANVQLAQYMPRNLYSLSCIHSVYDAGCAPNAGNPGGGPSRAANTFASYAGPASSKTFIAWGGGVAPPYPSQFGLGYITFTSGENNGATRTIVNGNTNVNGVQLSYALYAVPAPGDTYTVTYGCNRTKGAAGCGFFNNLQHYRGFLHVPPAEFGV